jgi:4-alpha-glucanotransferase
VYDWAALQRGKFAWWVSRFRHALGMFDLVRIDHFRGLVAGWQVKPGAADARKGKWVKGPADKLFATLKRSFRQMPFVAEDLGHITPDVTALREQYGLPGMKVLQFSFGSSPAPTVDDVAEPETFLYTGTHDNNTAPGWLKQEASVAEKKRVAEFLGHPIRTSSFGFDLASAALRSRAAVVITPVQDLLNLGFDARMNTPATVEGNWEWRLASRQLSDALARRLGRVVEETGRLP